MRPHPWGGQQEVSSTMTRKKATNFFFFFYICWLFTGEAESLSRCPKYRDDKAASFSSLTPTKEKQGPRPYSENTALNLPPPHPLPASLFPALHVLAITSDQQGAPVCFLCQRPDVRRLHFPWPRAPRLYLSGPERLVGVRSISVADRLFHSCCFHLD